MSDPQPSPVDVLPSPEEWTAFRSTATLTQQEIVAALAALTEVPGLGEPVMVDGRPAPGRGPLTAHQARYLASVIEHRVKEHRNRTYALAFAHGVDHERREAEDRRLRAELDD